MGYNREIELKEKLNSFLVNKLKIPEEDYYANLNRDGLLELKSILSGINNIFTLKVSIAFIEWVSDFLQLNKKVKEKIITDFINTKPNTNGYDIELDSSCKLVAEVKCNVPINKGKIYGSRQKSNIEKDIKNLLNGKIKSKIKPNGFFKFMVFLDTEEIRDATKLFVQNQTKYQDELVFLEKNKFQKDDIKDGDKVYIVFVSFEKDDQVADSDTVKTDDKKKTEKESAEKKVPIWKLIQQTIESMDGKAEKKEIINHLLDEHSHLKKNTLQCQVTICTVNNPTRINWAQNKKPRTERNQYDFLYQTDKKTVVMYDPKEHGKWGIVEDKVGKLMVTKLSN